MAQLLVRNLGEEVVQTLKQLAAHNNRSLQVEVKSILDETHRLECAKSTAKRRFKKLRTKFKDYGLENSLSVIREERNTR
jgi:plasmid stability protein